MDGAGPEPESGIQNLTGTPASYDARPEARRSLEQLPAAWDETRLLAGEPGSGAVVARRAGARWFIGGTYAGAARTAAVPLRIGRGSRPVETVTEGPAGLVRTAKVARGGAMLEIRVVANGGFAAKACPRHPGSTTCDRRHRELRNRWVALPGYDVQPLGSTS
ncbi:glycoside hydrolase family 97 C-terminal domain-containing protein [Streptomyces sp. NPDC019443]|uniref:glycoside hydrolase family 97 C-terminal domain-containing protein n=1 Tax=Streptomyces sp. NPDC019443 TaxID=3365061 RepID=UPI0037ABF808